ncbi:hypothetical protein D3C80_990710 [compost metagenome]
MGGQQLFTHALRGHVLLQHRLPDVGAVFAKAALGGVDQCQGAVQAQLVDEVGVGGEGITPAHRRALAQGAAGSDDRHQQDHEEHHATHIPGRCAGHLAFIHVIRPGQAVDALEQQAQQPGAKGPGQQVAHHREAVPEHAQDGFRVFLDVLEHQAVEALVELAIEVHLHQAEEHDDARGDGQPGPEQAARGHRPGAEDCQQQRNAKVHHNPQVEAQAIEETLGHGRHRRVADHVVVVDQQGQANQAEHQHDHQTAQQGVGQMRFQRRLQRARCSPLLTQGVRGSHELEDP